MAGLQPKFAIADKESSETRTDSRIIEKLKPISSFGEFLISCNLKSDFWPLMELLKTMGPSTIDAEIRSLSSDISGSQELMTNFLEAMEELLKTNRDFELIQSYLGLFLKIHIEEISNSNQMIAKCQHLSALTEESWNKLSKEFNKSLCLVNYLRSAVL